MQKKKAIHEHVHSVRVCFRSEYLAESSGDILKLWPGHMCNHPDALDDIHLILLTLAASGRQWTELIATANATQKGKVVFCYCCCDYYFIRVMGASILIYQQGLEQTSNRDTEQQSRWY